MSLDRRLRADLERQANTIDVDVERNLGAVEARARARGPIGAPMLVAAAAVLIAIALRFGPTLPYSGGGPTSSPSRSSAESPAPEPSGQTSYDAIAGTFVVTLDATNPTIGQNGLGGTWTMRLVADGEIFLSPPAAFGTGAGGLSGLAFNLTDDRFRNNIFYNDFCSSIGTYTWSLQAGRLSFAPVDDTCSIRRALLSTMPWRTGP